MPRNFLTTFRVDATVPLGHSLCGGWIAPAREITEPLLALGCVLLGEEAPVVVAAIDWTGICNRSHTRFREALARAAHTTPDRVALHAVHPHNAPFVDDQAQKLAEGHAGLPAIFDRAWFDGVVARTAEAVAASLKQPSAVSHVAFGQATVEKVASNRRIIGPEGQLIAWRASACTDAKLRDLPEGLIDAQLRTLAFLDGTRPVAMLHAYACHPMSYYGDGKVTPDFVGIAREQRRAETGVHQVYFTGCAGNIAAGKYNDGRPENRGILAERVLTAMRSAARTWTVQPFHAWHWKSVDILPPPRAEPTSTALLKMLADPSARVADRLRSAMRLAYRERAELPLVVGSLQLGDRVATLHLPAEAFVEFQLYGQSLRPRDHVLTAAYGDDGPWYLPTAEAYAQGGYEVSASFVESAADRMLRDVIRAVLA